MRKSPKKIDACSNKNIASFYLFYENASENIKNRFHLMQRDIYHLSSNMVGKYKGIIFFSILFMLQDEEQNEWKHLN